ncbi:hypothetical protein SAP269_06930 [Spiroplasma ixodetis]|uniref:Integrase catalytic domain-containing protein n=1 Tax=Spiroplasma ixodetis TaxID=2141 RepID=A0ABM8JM28_9MOLU
MCSNRCLKDIQIFHSDLGNEFNNKTIDKLLLAFDITRSLSKKGCPYDNAVAEATFKTFKTEFINDKNFTSLIQLKLELFDYINWYHNIRIHSTLNYLTPIKHQAQMSTKKKVLKNVAIPGCHSKESFNKSNIKSYNNQVFYSRHIAN